MKIIKSTLHLLMKSSSITGAIIETNNGFVVQILNKEEIEFWNERERRMFKDQKELKLHFEEKEEGCFVPQLFEIKNQAEAISLFKDWSKVMFGQIFFGLNDDILAKETGRKDFHSWAEYSEAFIMNNCSWIIIHLE